MIKQVRKITMSAMLIALTVIALKVIAINPGYLFVRISFGPALIIFSSLYLGPIYGCLVGAGSDLLGAVLFKQGAYEPLFTLIYGLLGILPWVLNFLLKFVKNRRFAEFLFDLVFILWTIVVVSLVWLYPQIDKLNLKIIYSCLAVILSIGTVIAIHFISKYFKKKNPEYDGKFYRYALICLITEIVLLVFSNSLVKSIHFDEPYMLMVEWMALISFINIPINTFGSYYLEMLVNKVH